MVKLCRHRGSRSRQCPGPRLLQHFFAARLKLCFGHVYIYIYVYIYTYMFRNVSFLVAHGYCTPYLLEATLLQGTEKDCAISATPSTITMHSGRQERKNHPFPQTSRLHGHILRCHRYLAVLPDGDLFQQANCKLNPKFCRLGTNLTHGKHIVRVIRVQSAGGTLGLVMVCHGLSISASLQSPSDPSDGPT